MKVKKINDDKFTIKCNHKELILLKEALRYFYLLDSEDLQTLNNQLFDKDEFTNVSKVNLKLSKMF